MAKNLERHIKRKEKRVLYAQIAIKAEKIRWKNLKRHIKSGKTRCLYAQIAIKA